MAQPNVHGRFVWQELNVQDTAAAAAFYSKVVGWHTQVPPGMPDYTMFTAGGGAGVGGLQKLAANARPHWLPYLGAQDVDETATAAVRLGAKLLKAPFDLQTGGRIALLSDPQGAVFGLHHSSQPGPAPADPTKPGQFSWQELATTDYEAAFKFYAELFGWQVLDRMTMGPSNVYLIFGWDGQQQGGIYKPSKPGTATQWLPYATVTDIEATVATVAKAGGQVVHGPVPVPGGGRIAQLLDVGGALFAVHSFPSAASAAAAPKPAAKPAPAKAPAPTAPAAAPAKPAAAKPPAAAPKPAAPAKAAPKPAAKQPAARKAAAKKPARQPARKKGPPRTKAKVKAKVKVKAKGRAKAKSRTKPKARVGKRPAARRGSAKRRPASSARRKK
jgi:predicted enzyme related to lactoylglutathione lyase